MNLEFAVEWGMKKILFALLGKKKYIYLQQALKYTISQ